MAIEKLRPNVPVDQDTDKVRGIEAVRGSGPNARFTYDENVSEWSLNGNFAVDGVATLTSNNTDDTAGDLQFRGDSQGELFSLDDGSDPAQSARYEGSGAYTVGVRIKDVSGTDVLGDRSVVLGGLAGNSTANVASGIGSVAIGENNISGGLGNFGIFARTVAIGTSNEVRGERSVSIGGAISPGDAQTIFGPNSLAFGFNQEIGGTETALVGVRNTASGADNAYILGADNTVATDSAIIGKNNTAGGFGAGINYILGLNNSTSETNTFILGSGNTVDSTQSIAIGRNNSIDGFDSDRVVIGANNSILNDADDETVLIGAGLSWGSNFTSPAVVLGQFNEDVSGSVTSRSVVIGGGTGDTNRDNLAVIQRAGFQTNDASLLQVDSGYIGSTDPSVTGDWGNSTLVVGSNVTDGFLNQCITLGGSFDVQSFSGLAVNSDFGEPEDAYDGSVILNSNLPSRPSPGSGEVIGEVFLFGSTIQNKDDIDKLRPSDQGFGSPNAFSVFDDTILAYRSDGNTDDRKGSIIIAGNSGSGGEINQIARNSVSIGGAVINSSNVVGIGSNTFINGELDLQGTVTSSIDLQGFEIDNVSGDLIIVDPNDGEVARFPTGGPVEFKSGLAIDYPIRIVEDEVSPFIDVLSTASATAGESVGYSLDLDNELLARVIGESDGSGNVVDRRFEVLDGTFSIKNFNASLGQFETVFKVNENGEIVEGQISISGSDISAAGNDGAVQFNDNGDFAADPEFTYQPDTGELLIEGNDKSITNGVPGVFGGFLDPITKLQFPFEQITEKTELPQPFSGFPSTNTLAAGTTFQPQLDEDYSTFSRTFFYPVANEQRFEAQNPQGFIDWGGTEVNIVGYSDFTYHENIKADDYLAESVFGGQTLRGSELDLTSSRRPNDPVISGVAGAITVEHDGFVSNAAGITSEIDVSASSSGRMNKLSALEIITSGDFPASSLTLDDDFYGVLQRSPFMDNYFEGTITQSSGGILSNKDTSAREYHLNQRTEGTGTENLFIDSQGIAELPKIPDSGTWHFEAKVVARVISASSSISSAENGDTHVWRVEGVATSTITNPSLGTKDVRTVGQPSVFTVANDSSTQNYNLDVNVTPQGELELQAEGASGDTVHWTADLSVGQIIG